MGGANKGLDVAALLRAAMLEAGISNADLARACGVTKQAITGWRQTGRIAKSRLLKVAEATRKPPEYFLGAVEIPSKRSAIRIAKTEIIDADDFRTVAEAWQDTDSKGRQTMLGLATALRRAASAQAKRRSGKD